MFWISKEKNICSTIQLENPEVMNSVHNTLTAYIAGSIYRCSSQERQLVNKIIKKPIPIKEWDILRLFNYEQ